jgi:hypothetical protein
MGSILGSYDSSSSLQEFALVSMQLDVNYTLSILYTGNQLVTSTSQILKAEISDFGFIYMFFAN